MAQRKQKQSQGMIIAGVAFRDGMYALGLVTPLLTLPQLLLIWSGHASGVSLTTWGGYMVISGLWLVYGLIKRDRVIIVAQASLFTVNIGVVIGLFVR